MKVYIVKENGYEGGESIITGVYLHVKDAKSAINDLRKNIDPLDKDWLFYSLEEAEVKESY